MATRQDPVLKQQQQQKETKKIPPKNLNKNIFFFKNRISIHNLTFIL